MKDTRLWEAAMSRTNEQGYKDDDVKKLASVLIYMSEQQNRNIESIKNNVRFFFYLGLLSLIGSIVAIMMASS